MELWAIVPVKPFAHGKSRLASVLGAGERIALNRRLFEHVSGIVLGAFGARRTIVVSADTELLAWVRPAHAVADPAGGDLNAALAQACRYAAEHGADAIAVLPSDLPDLAPADIDALRQALTAPPSCVIAPDAIDEGTNALLLAPPAPGFFQFGRQSFAAHAQGATARGYTTRVVRRPGLAHDLDTPEGYRRWLKRMGVPA